MHARTILVATLVVGGLLATSTAANAAGYNFTTIDAPGTSITEASGINGAGQAVGVFFKPREHGFLYTGGSLTNFDVPGASDTDALRINHAGQIVGDFGSHN